MRSWTLSFGRLHGLILAVCVGASACGGDEPVALATLEDAGTQDATVSDAVGDGVDADAAGDADGGNCSQRQPCDPDGPACTNSCGKPCSCIQFGPGYEWDCERPLTGELCDPVLYPAPYNQCIYPPYLNSDLGHCECQAPAGDYFWSCSGYDADTVCPQQVPNSGDSCSAFPTGLFCHFLGDADPGPVCECVNNGAKLWDCT